MLTFQSVSQFSLSFLACSSRICCWRRAYAAFKASLRSGFCTFCSHNQQRCSHYSPPQKTPLKQSPSFLDRKGSLAKSKGEIHTLSLQRTTERQWNHVPWVFSASAALLQAAHHCIEKHTVSGNCHCWTHHTVTRNGGHKHACQMQETVFTLSEKFKHRHTVYSSEWTNRILGILWILGLYNATRQERGPAIGLYASARLIFRNHTLFVHICS